MNQQYDKYTAADQLMWRQLFEQQMAQLPSIASTAYLEGIEKVGFVADHIPDFERETNPRLRALTGWEVAVVPGLIPQQEFFEMLSQRRFPASTWLRQPDQLAYLEEPDMFHDTFGHIPLLTNQHFCNFMKELSHIALHFMEAPDAIVQIGRLYWYTVEFGLIQEQGELKIYGGGILSSVGESQHCLRAEVPKRAFDVATLLQTPYHIDHYQDHYFVIDSYEQLYSSTTEIQHLLQREFLALA